MNKISDRPNLNHIFCKAATSVAVATTVSLGLFGEAAPAASFTVNQTTNGITLTNYLFGSVKGLSNFQVNLTGNEQAFGTFYDDPFGLGEGVVLSTGLVEEIPGPNTADGFNPDLSTDLLPEDNYSGDSVGDPFDVAILEISFDTDSTVSGLMGDFVFGSEEFVEWGGDIFKDDLTLVTLNGVNIAKLSDGQEVNINNLVPNPDGTGTHPDYINNPVNGGAAAGETKLDGFTKVLPFEGKLIPNSRNTFTVTIRDISDPIYDSAVFISNVRPVPEPTSLVGLLGLGALGAGSLLKRKQKSANRD